MEAGNSGNKFVNLPRVPFFMSMLSHVDNFGWAKDFLLSGAPSLLDDKKGTIIITVPKDCATQPTPSSTVCISELHIDVTRKSLAVDSVMEAPEMSKALFSS